MAKNKKRSKKKYNPPSGSNSSGRNYDNGSDSRYNKKFHGANTKANRVNAHAKRGNI